MAIKNSEAVRNAALESFETTIGTSPKLRLYTGAPPALITAAATGTMLAEISLPSDWLAAASGGSKAKLGTWSVAAAAASGEAGYYRILNSGGTVTHEQGTVTQTGGGGDLMLDNPNIATGQQITIATYTRTAGNA